MSAVAPERITTLNDHRPREDGRYVLYWMVAARRTRWNHALEHAIHVANARGVGLVVLEALRCGYRWASDRMHRFVLDGMIDNGRALEAAGAASLRYVEPEAGAGKGLLEALAAEAVEVVTDDWPCFFVPKMTSTAGRNLDVRLSAVDSNGIVPIRSTPKAFPTAYSFRSWFQKNGRQDLLDRPLEEPLRALKSRAAPAIPGGLTERWPMRSLEELASPSLVRDLPIDHDVAPVETGGAIEGARRLAAFCDSTLDGYADDRNHPDRDSTSRLSAHLHFGHIAGAEVVHRILERARWTPDQLAQDSRGKRAGWWGLDPATEGFLDQIVTWRELGFTVCTHMDNYDRWESLPEWARLTLEEHAADPREHVYDLETLTAAETHDEIWNAAQRQLVRDGVMHNYLRMLWAKRVLEWTPHPRESLDILIHLNNRFATDGRDPNSYSGIFWTFGRHDRAWGPKRPIFGTIRYMSSANTRRKLKLDTYLERYGAQGQLF